MEVQVEVQFTVQHTLEQLRDAFVKRGHIPEWHVIEEGATKPELFFETRIVSLTLTSESDRYAWFIFSMEACGELRRRVVIPNVVPASVNLGIPELQDFLAFCRTCLVGPVGSSR